MGSIDQDIYVSIEEVFNDKTKSIQDEFIDSFEVNLESFPGSLSNPDIFFETFKEEITEYEYVKTYEDEDTDDQEVKIVLPNIETFKYSKELVTLQFMSEGLAGTFYEIPEAEISNITDPGVQQFVNNLPGVTDSEIIENRYRLIPDNVINKVQMYLDTELVLSPLSNFTPVDIFTQPTDYVADNIQDWISEGISAALEKREK